MPLPLACIADDLTGATDMASMLAHAGMQVEQVLGVPTGDRRGMSNPDAVVVALKSRSTPPDAAIADSLEAASRCAEAGARRLYFKICSTFDSTDRGNIGPVADALLAHLGENFAAVCPALPVNGRTVYRGHLFVGNRLLAESSMRDHPLNPMLDSDLVRLLERQTRPGSVGRVEIECIERGADAIRSAFQDLRRAGCRYAVCDAWNATHLRTLAAACADLALTVGASGLAQGLAEELERRGEWSPVDAPSVLPKLQGAVAILAGSCSEATRAQVAALGGTIDAVPLNPSDLTAGPRALEATVERILTRLGAGLDAGRAVLVSSSMTAVQEGSGEQVERAFARLACRLAELGVKKWIVAGGETSGAVAEALGVRSLRVGPEIVPGVAWTVRTDTPTMVFAFKSGNFGGVDFFERALELLP